MRARRLARGPVEFALIVVGVLAALLVDALREEAQERRILDEALSDVAAEVEGNAFTINNLRTGVIARKLEALARVAAFVSDPDIPVLDTTALMGDLVTSARVIRPWLIDDRYVALRSSGMLRLLRDSELARELASFYESPEILFTIADQSRGRYLEVVNEIVPMEMADEVNQLRGYVPSSLRDTMTVPGLDGAPDYASAVRDFRARAEELRVLARSEAAYGAGYLFAFARYMWAREQTLESLEPWRKNGEP